MKIHELKTVQPYFNDVACGFKKFEVRKNDRDFEVGDMVILKLYNKENESFDIDDQYIILIINYILDSEFYCKEGFIIFGFDTIYRHGRF